MQKITDGRYDNEFNKEMRVPKFTLALQGLEVEEILELKKEDWKNKTSVSQLVSIYTKQPQHRLFGKKFITRTLSNDTGWVIKRIK